MKRPTLNCSKPLLLVALFLTTASDRALAQVVEQLREEVYGFGGIYHGAGLTAGTVGAGAAYAVHRRVRAIGEGYYFRKDLSEAIGVSALEAKGSALAFEGVVHVLFPMRETRTVPFVAGGIGMGRAKATVAGRVGGRTIQESLTDTVGHFVVGGGIDYYIRDNWGIRPEFRWYTGNEIRITFGISRRF